MAYVLYDDNGYLAPGPTIQGLEDLHSWAANKPVVKQFLEDGVTADTQSLADALRTADSEDRTEIGDMHAALFDAATRAQGQLGLSDEGEDDEEDL